MPKKNKKRLVKKAKKEKEAAEARGLDEAIRQAEAKAALYEAEVRRWREIETTDRYGARCAQFRQLVQGSTLPVEETEQALGGAGGAGLGRGQRAGGRDVEAKSWRRPRRSPPSSTTWSSGSSEAALRRMPPVGRCRSPPPEGREGRWRGASAASRTRTPWGLHAPTAGGRTPPAHGMSWAVAASAALEDGRALPSASRASTVRLRAEGGQGEGGRVS